MQQTHAVFGELAHWALQSWVRNMLTMAYLLENDYLPKMYLLLPLSVAIVPQLLQFLLQQSHNITQC